MINVSPTTIDNIILSDLPGYIIYNLIAFTTAKVTPTIIATEDSFNKTFKTSFNSISSVARPLIIIVEACAPQLPPVSIIIGINDTSIATWAKASS